MAKNKEREVGDLIEEKGKYYDMATLIKDVDNESGSQTGCKGTTATRQKPGTPREVHRRKCLYHKQSFFIRTVSINH